MADTSRVATSLLFLVLPFLFLFAAQQYDATLLARYAPAWLLDFIPGHSSLARSQIPIVMAGIPFFSHLEKLTPIAAGLVKLGYPVTFVTGEEFRSVIEPTGATFEPLDGPAGLMDMDLLHANLALPHMEREIAMAKAAFIDRIPDQHHTLQRVFDRLRLSHGQSAPMVYLHDTAFFGILPVMFGAQGIRPTSAMGIGVSPVAVNSNDTYPFPARSPPDTSADARAIHFAAHQEAAKTPSKQASNSALVAVLESLGASKPTATFLDAFGNYDDGLLQLGIPEFDYPRSDIAVRIDYLGAPKTVGMRAEPPEWWGDIQVAEAAGKHIIVVTQGSAYPDLNNLLVPTLQALKDREDVLVIATLVLHEPHEVDFEIPANARVAKFVPFDVLLPKATLLIASGGYGTVLQGLSAGVPMLLAGTSQDKAHVGALSAWAGVAVNLGVDAPGVDAIRVGVEELLRPAGDSDEGRSRYKRRAEELAELNRGYDALEIVDRRVLEAVGR